jgi:hypothetical protein
MLEIPAPILYNLIVIIFLLLTKQNGAEKDMIVIQTDFKINSFCKAHYSA